jgi:membrane-associated phospholipid phosphatase
MERFFFHMENDYADLYGSIQQKYHQLHAQYANETSPEILERSEQWGRDVASAIYEWEQTDTKGHNAFLNAQPQDYVPPVGAGLWYDFRGQRGMFPYWGQVRTFAINETDKVARKPIPYSEDPNSLFYAQAEEVYKTVKFINEHPTDPLAYEQKWLAEFWSDDILNLTFSPPPRLVAIADQIAVAENINLADAAEMYAKLGMALHDNGVAIWHSKYLYNVERPDTYIRRVLPSEYADASEWVSILNNPYSFVYGMSPAFPAYPSGHSGFGGAGAKILSSLFEYTDKHPGTYTMTDRCHLDRVEFIGIPRTFRSLSDIGKEDAYSRVPLGVHYRMDCDEGLRLGELAAQRVLELPWKK